MKLVRVIWIADFEHIYPSRERILKKLLLLLQLHLHSGGQGVIEIIFIREILAKFPSREDNRQWHRIIGLYSHHWLFTYPLVWSIVFISDKGNARSLTDMIKAISSHTFFYLSAFIWELV